MGFSALRLKGNVLISKRGEMRRGRRRRRRRSGFLFTYKNIPSEISSFSPLEENDKKIVNLYPTIVRKAFISEIPLHLSLESIKNHRLVVTNRILHRYNSISLLVFLTFHLSHPSNVRIVPSLSFYPRHSLSPSLFLFASH